MYSWKINQCEPFWAGNLPIHRVICWGVILDLRKLAYGGGRGRGMSSCPDFIVFLQIHFFKLVKGPGLHPGPHTCQVWKQSPFWIAQAYEKHPMPSQLRMRAPSPHLDNSLKGLNRALWKLPKAICFRAGPQTWEIAVRKKCERFTSSWMDAFRMEGLF